MSVFASGLVCVPVLLTNLCVFLALWPINMKNMVSYFQQSSVICFWVSSSLLCNLKKLQRHRREMKRGHELEPTSNTFPAVTGIIATVVTFVTDADCSALAVVWCDYCLKIDQIVWFSWSWRGGFHTKSFLLIKIINWVCAAVLLATCFQFRCLWPAGLTCLE